MSKSKDKFFGDLNEAEATVETPAVVEEVVLETAPEEPVLEETTINADDVNLTHTSLGMFTDSRGRYQIAKIKFDPISGVTGSVDTTLEAAMDKMTAEETFKLSVVREGVFTS